MKRVFHIKKGMGYAEILEDASIITRVSDVLEEEIEKHNGVTVKENIKITIESE